MNSPAQQKSNSMTRGRKIELAAHEKWAQGQLNSAFRLFMAAAKLGETYSQLDLGYFYQNGLGVRRNRDAAMYWYKRAYRNGDGGAANNIGTIYRDEGKFSRAIDWLKRAVRLGETSSNLTIAEILIEKRKNAEEAAPYLHLVLSAKRGVDVSEATWDKAENYLKRE